MNGHGILNRYSTRRIESTPGSFQISKIRLYDHDALVERSMLSCKRDGSTRD